MMPKSQGGHRAAISARANFLRRFLLLLALINIAGFAAVPAFAQKVPRASGARILLLPKTAVCGERATLAVLDVDGRLTPDVKVAFSNGDRLTTDATGRALFVAPLTPGVISGSIAGRPGKVYMVVVSAAEAAAASPAIQISSAPRFASLSDRFDVSGSRFCGEADANRVSVSGKPGLVLASSPVSLSILPPPEIDPGLARVSVACGRAAPKTFSMTLLSLSLEADASPLAPGEHRILHVRVRGTSSKVALEARNLAPEIAGLVAADEPLSKHENAAQETGANLVRASSSGGAQNIARFEVVGRQLGAFIVSIRLASTQGAPSTD